MVASFSVVLPVYSRTNIDHFREALHSIRTQTLLPNEIIIVVDGPISTKLDLEVKRWIRDYPPLNISTVILGENLGLGVGLARGLAACKHPLIARMDSDDVAVSSRFKRQVNFLQNHPEIDVVGTWMLEFEVDLTIPQSQKKVPTSHNEIAIYAKYRNPMNHPTVMFRKEAAIIAGGYQEMPYYEDYYLWVRMIQKGFVFANISEYLLHYRMDTSFYERRQGIGYLKHQYNFFKKIHQLRFISFSQFLTILIKRSIAFILPSQIRKRIYKSLRT